MNSNSNDQRGRNRGRMRNNFDGNPMENKYPGVDATFMMAIEKYVTEFMNSNLMQFEFPNTFTNVHRKYVHNYTRKMGLKSQSHGKGKNANDVFF
jgi:hypothetical protein